MRLLLDTHVYLWWLSGDKHLSKTTKSLILGANEVYISSASIWEASIKIRLGKLKADISVLVAAISASSFLELPITVAHAAALDQLPPLHKDPFDRILIAQAISEPLKLLTADELLPPYSDLIQII